MNKPRTKKCVVLMTDDTGRYMGCRVWSRISLGVGRCGRGWSIKSTFYNPVSGKFETQTFVVLSKKVRTKKAAMSILRSESRRGRDGGLLSRRWCWWMVTPSYVRMVAKSAGVRVRMLKGTPERKKGDNS